MESIPLIAFTTLPCQLENLATSTVGPILYPSAIKILIKSVHNGKPME